MKTATNALLRLSVAEEKELLFKHGINFQPVTELPEARHRCEGCG